MASAVPALDSSALATQLKAKVPSVTKIVTITENNDPNNKIGRPNGYVSAAVLYDPSLNCDASRIRCGLRSNDRGVANRGRCDRACHIHTGNPQRWRDGERVGLR